MTNLADLNQRVEVPEAGFANKAATTPKIYLDTQIDEGNSSTYSAAFTVQTQVKKDATNNLRLSYTPTVDVWWEVSFHEAIVYTVTDVWNYCYGFLYLTPDRTTGPHRARYVIWSGRSTLGQHANRQVTALWALNANTAYTADAYMVPNAGSWHYHQGAEFLGMHGKAWAR